MISKSQKAYSHEKLTKAVEYLANIIDLITVTTARSAVPGVSPGRGLLMVH